MDWFSDRRKSMTPPDNVRSPSSNQGGTADVHGLSGAGQSPYRSENRTPRRSAAPSIKSVSYADDEESAVRTPPNEISEDESRIGTPQNTGLGLPITGPGLLALTTKPTAPAMCPRCGMKIDASDTKMIPTQKVWAIFTVLFVFGCWWISWLPFLCRSFTEPVEICPHCYRRTDRRIIDQDIAEPTEEA